jgi:hypothetical protein
VLTPGTEAIPEAIPEVMAAAEVVDSGEPVHDLAGPAHHYLRPTEYDGSSEFGSPPGFDSPPGVDSPPGFDSSPEFDRSAGPAGSPEYDANDPAAWNTPGWGIQTNPPKQQSSPAVELLSGPPHDAGNPTGWGNIEVTEPRPEETGSHQIIPTAHPYFYRQRPGDDSTG